MYVMKRISGRQVELRKKPRDWNQVGTGVTLGGERQPSIFVGTLRAMINHGVGLS